MSGRLQTMSLSQLGGGNNNPLGHTPWRDYQPFNGGIMRVLTGITNSVDYTIQHTLRRVPVGMVVVYSTATAYSPKWRISSATPWNASNITVQFDTPITSPDFIVVWVF